MSFLLHETIIRGKKAIEKLARTHLVLCGVGTIGSNLAENLVRQGFNKFTLIDFDRVEEHNIGTQAYYQDSIGMKKVDALFNQLYRISSSISVRPVDKKIDITNVRKLLHEADLVIDSLDKTEAREVVTQCCKTQNINCLHLGLAEYYGEVMWNEQYRVPKEIGEDQCNYPLARNTVMLTIAVASEAIVRFVLASEKISYFTTSKDLTIERMEV